MLLAGPGAAHASSLTVSAPPSQQTLGALTITAQGTADQPATLRVFVQQGAATCAGGGSVAEGAQAQSARAGSTEVITQQASGPFRYSGEYTPPTHGGYAVCGYLFGFPRTADDIQISMFLILEPPPPPPPPPADEPAPAGEPGAAPAPEPRCVVPTLKGRTSLGARKLIRRAGCSVGIVVRPGLRASRSARAQGRVLRVVSQGPKPRVVLKANARVMLRLAYVTPRRSSRL